MPGLALTLLAYLGFIAIGLPDGLLGVAWPSIRGEFHLQVADLGPLLGLFTAGYLASSFLGGWLTAGLGIGRLLALSCGLTSLALAIYALAPAWGLLLTAAPLAGVGAGAIDAGINTYAATRFSRRAVNWLHASYGVGAAAGPALMTAALMQGHSWQLGYAVVAALQLLLALAFARTRHRWRSGATADSAATTPAPLFSTLRLPVVGYSVAVFFVYTGVEAAAGLWIYSVLAEAHGLPMARAGSAVSLYWASLTAGRLLLGSLSSRLDTKVLLRGCVLGLTCGAVLLWQTPEAAQGALAPALMGFAAGAVFPTLMASSPARLGEVHAANGVGFQVAAAALGQSALPTLLGLGAQRYGLTSIAPALVAALLVLLVLLEALLRFSPPAARTQPLEAAS